jgi:hypothetical protein
VWPIVGVAALVVAAAIAAALYFGLRDSGGKSSTKPNRPLTQALAAAGCTFKTYPSVGRTHLQPGDPTPKYNSFPPTSGPHDPVPAVWNFYDAPLVQTTAVHNLEHGGIVIQWGSGVPQAQIERLRAFWQESPNAMLLAPLPQLGHTIAVAAWTHLAKCPRFDSDAFAAFRNTYRGKGPERFPVSILKPGT